MKRCPECREFRPWKWFAASEHCGSPDVAHEVCALCQQALATEAARDQAVYFATLGTTRAAA